VCPASEKTGLGRRAPAFHPKDSGNPDSLAAEVSDQCISRGVISDRGDGQNAGAKRREVVGSVRSAARNDLGFAMFKDQNWGFARDAGDFSVLKFVGHKITKENNRFRIELLDTLA